MAAIGPKSKNDIIGAGMHINAKRMRIFELFLINIPLSINNKYNIIVSHGLKSLIMLDMHHISKYRHTLLQIIGSICI